MNHLELARNDFIFTGNMAWDQITRTPGFPIKKFFSVKTPETIVGCLDIIPELQSAIEQLIKCYDNGSQADAIETLAKLKKIIGDSP